MADKIKPFLDKPLKKINFGKFKNPSPDISNNILVELKRLIEDQNYEEAIKKCTEEIDKSPNASVLWDVAAFSYQKLKIYNEAIKCYEKVLSIDSSSITSYFNLGIIYYDLGQLNTANELFMKCVEIDKNFKEVYLPHAKTLFKLQKFDLAKESCSKSISLTGLNKEKANLMACILVDLMELDEAEKFFEICLDEELTNHNHLNNYATFLKVVNKLDKSADLYLKVLEINNDYSPAFRHLSEIAPEKITDSILLRMKKNLSNKDTSEEFKAHIGFGLWEYSSYKKSDNSFQFLKQGNDNYRKVVAKSFSLTPDQISTNSIKEKDDYLINQAKLRNIVKEKLKNENHKNDKIDPIFIVGLPRSGTTLVEQILSSHPNINGGGELRYVNDIYHSIISSKEWETETFSDDYFLKFRSQYIDKIKKYSTSNTKSIIDKMPANFFFVGLIKLIFPDSKVINIERNSMDNCFSIYTKLFSAGHAYAYNLEDIGNYYLMYKKTMNHWYKLLGQEIYKIQYENLVNDLEGETKKMLNYCNFNFHKDCLEFHKNKRPVLTASNIQVRKKIFKNSIGKWEKYSNNLKPLTKLIREET